RPRGARAPARDRSPRRRPDPRPRPTRAAQGGAASAARRRQLRAAGGRWGAGGRRASPRAAYRSVRTVYLGPAEFAGAVLRRLAASPHRTVLVVTPPDRPKGRGRHSGPPPAAVVAGELGVDLLQVEDVNDEVALERIRAARPEAIAVCAFGRL